MKYYLILVILVFLQFNKCSTDLDCEIEKVSDQSVLQEENFLIPDSVKAMAFDHVFSGVKKLQESMGSQKSVPDSSKIKEYYSFIGKLKNPISDLEFYLFNDLSLGAESSFVISLNKKNGKVLDTEQINNRKTGQLIGESLLFLINQSLSDTSVLEQDELPLIMDILFYSQYSRNYFYKISGNEKIKCSNKKKSKKITNLIQKPSFSGSNDYISLNQQFVLGGSELIEVELFYRKDEKKVYLENYKSVKKISSSKINL